MNDQYPRCDYDIKKMFVLSLHREYKGQEDEGGKKGGGVEIVYPFADMYRYTRD